MELLEAITDSKLNKNHFLEFVIYTQSEKYHTFFVDFTRVHKTWNKCQFFQIKWTIFRICLEYCLTQFSQVIVLFQLSRKSQNEKFLELFQLFAVFVKIEKCRLFSTFSVRPLIFDSCQKWREMKCSLGWDTFAPFFNSVHDVNLGVISFVEKPCFCWYNYLYFFTTM